MTTIQETKLNMYLAVRDFLIPNESITKDLPNFGANYAVLKETILNIQAISEKQKSDKKGLAKLKNELRDKLIALVVDNSRKITAFAKFSNNTILQNEVKFTQSGFSKMTDTGLKDYAQIVYDKGQANLDALPSYGITAETQKSLIETITAYNESISKPRVGLAERSQATKELITLFDTVDTILGNMDLAVEIIRLPQKNFYDGYKTARKIVETSAGKLTLKAQATEKKTGLPVKGALFIFKALSQMFGATSGNGEIVKKTEEKGRFHVKNMPAGTYQVTVSKPGYQDKTETVIVADGEMTDLRVELEKV
jgi:hypothetical protein